MERGRGGRVDGALRAHRQGHDTRAHILPSEGHRRIGRAAFGKVQQVRGKSSSNRKPIYLPTNAELN